MCLIALPILILVWIFFQKIFLDLIYYKKNDKNQEIPVEGKVVIITGGNTGIGKVVAGQMADRGAVVILACRNLKAAHQAMIDIRNTTLKGTLTPIRLDLASLKSVREFVDEVKKKFTKIDILINNGGINIPCYGKKRKRTEDGFEIHFGVNHLGHFLLTNLLLDLISKAENGRIVSISSTNSSLGKFDFEDLMLDNLVIKRTTPFDLSSVPLYNNSKLANFYMCYELAKRLKGTNIKTYSLCPGFVKTDVFRYSVAMLSSIWHKMIFATLLFLVSKTPLQGAQTVLYCSLSKNCENESGLIYRNCEVMKDDCFKFPEDLASKDTKFWTKISDKDSNLLWEASERLVGLK